MRRLLRMLLAGFSWGLAACLTIVELLLAWAWLRGTLYVMKYGAEENPYAAEDAEIAGFFAALLLPLALAALSWAAYETILWWKDREKPRPER